MPSRCDRRQIGASYMETAAAHDRPRWLLTLAVLAISTFLVYWFWSDDSRPDPAALLPADPPQAAQGPEIGVDVVGAVLHPGLYFFPQGARVDDAIKAAGGFAPNADRDAVNLAIRLKDESQLRVPHVGGSQGSPAEAPAPAAVDASAPRSNLVDLNLANQAELEQLPGIGPETARQIVDYRDTHGPFESIAQLDDVPGIGPGTLDTLRDLITVGNRE
jgi:competence protein ComEA